MQGIEGRIPWDGEKLRRRVPDGLRYRGITILRDDFEGEPRDDEKEEGEEFVEAEEGMDRLGEVVFGYVEHPAVNLEDQWSESGDKDEAEQEEAEVDQHAPEEEMFQGLSCHGVG